MPGHTVKRIDEMEAVYGGAFKRARAELGISSFGMQVMDLPPNLDQYPEHDTPRTARRRSTWRCAGGARSRSRASGTSSSPRR